MIESVNELSRLNIPKKLLINLELEDLRKSYIGLSSKLRASKAEEVELGTGYIFINKSKKLAKLIWWDRTGWVVYQKKLQVGRYRVLEGAGFLELRMQEVQRFFDGV